MQFAVAGVGYTGRRVLAALGNGIGISRQPVDGLIAERLFVRDLDAAPVESVALSGPACLLYTIPPTQDAGADRRLARLLEALRPIPRRIVYLSTSGVYGDRGGALTDESVLPRPASDRSLRRWETEKLLINFGINTGCDSVILRVSGIYGPGRMGTGRLATATPILRESDANPGNRIHIDDLVSCCLAAMQPEAPAGIYNVGDGDFRSSTWFTLKVAEMMGAEPPPQVSREEAASTFPRHRLAFLRESRQLDTRKMRDTLGVLPRYLDAEEGIRDSLAEDGLLRL